MVSALNTESTAEPRELITFALGLESRPERESAWDLPAAVGTRTLAVCPGRSAAADPVRVGSRRVLPVRVIELQVKEQLFDATLTPTQAELSVTLQVLKEADLAAASKGRQLWDTHVLLMQELAKAVPLVALADLGLGGEGGSCRHDASWRAPLGLAPCLPQARDVVRRILAVRDRPQPDSAGPSS